jgi:transcriptional regulator with XRE-family HTH domain
MKINKNAVLPTVNKILTAFGDNIKLARLRRKLSAEQVSERANISRPTLLAIEKGQPGVAIGSYAQVLFVLNLEKDLLKVATDDVLGRKLQDAGLMVKKRAPKRTFKTPPRKA